MSQLYDKNAFTLVHHSPIRFECFSCLFTHAQCKYDFAWLEMISDSERLKTQTNSPLVNHANHTYKFP